jgi:hypothetical protein
MINLRFFSGSATGFHGVEVAAVCVVTADWAAAVLHQPSPVAREMPGFIGLFAFAECLAGHER